MEKIKRFSRKAATSRFGLEPIRRRIQKMRDRKTIIALLEKRQDKIPLLKNRWEIKSLLAAPALLHDSEVITLETYAGKADETIVEIGAAFGASSLLFLTNKKESAQVYSIDPFIKDSMGNFQATESGCRKHVSSALKDIGMKNRLKQWTLIRDYSYKAVAEWKKPIDVLFIDGDHRYDAVKKDFNDWLPLVKNGGYILFHDSCMPEHADEKIYQKGWPGPSRFARELASDGRVELIENVESLSVFKKKYV